MFIFLFTSFHLHIKEILHTLHRLQLRSQEHKHNEHTNVETISESKHTEQDHSTEQSSYARYQPTSLVFNPTFLRVQTLFSTQDLCVLKSALKAHKCSNIYTQLMLVNLSTCLLLVT